MTNALLLPLALLGWATYRLSSIQDEVRDGTANIAESPMLGYEALGGFLADKAQERRNLELVAAAGAGLLVLRL
jgi:hypothetical protein